MDNQVGHKTHIVNDSISSGKHSYRYDKKNRIIADNSGEIIYNSFIIPKNLKKIKLLLLENNNKFDKLPKNKNYNFSYNNNSLNSLEENNLFDKTIHQNTTENNLIKNKKEKEKKDSNSKEKDIDKKNIKKNSNTKTINKFKKIKIDDFNDKFLISNEKISQSNKINKKEEEREEDNGYNEESEDNEDNGNSENVGNNEHEKKEDDKKNENNIKNENNKNETEEEENDENKTENNTITKEKCSKKTTYEENENNEKEDGDFIGNNQKIEKEKTNDSNNENITEESIYSKNVQLTIVKIINLNYVKNIEKISNNTAEQNKKVNNSSITKMTNKSKSILCKFQEEQIKSGKKRETNEKNENKDDDEKKETNKNKESNKNKENEKNNEDKINNEKKENTIGNNINQSIELIQNIESKNSLLTDSNIKEYYENKIDFVSRFQVLSNNNKNDCYENEPKYELDFNNKINIEIIDNHFQKFLQDPVDQNLNNHTKIEHNEKLDKEITILDNNLDEISEKNNKKRKSIDVSLMEHNANKKNKEINNKQKEKISVNNSFIKQVSNKNNKEINDEQNEKKSFIDSIKQGSTKENKNINEKQNENNLKNKNSLNNDKEKNIAYYGNTDAITNKIQNNQLTEIRENKKESYDQDKFVILQSENVKNNTTELEIYNVSISSICYITKIRKLFLFKRILTTTCYISKNIKNNYKINNLLPEHTKVKDIQNDLKYGNKLDEKSELRNDILINDITITKNSNFTIKEETKTMLPPKISINYFTKYPKILLLSHNLIPVRNSLCFYSKLFVPINKIKKHPLLDKTENDKIDTNIRLKMLSPITTKQNKTKINFNSMNNSQNILVKGKEKINNNKKPKQISIINKNNEITSNKKHVKRSCDYFLLSPNIKQNFANDNLNIPDSKKSIFLNTKKNKFFDLKTKSNKLNKVQSFKAKPCSNDVKNKVFINSKNKIPNKKIFRDFNNIKKINRKKENFSNNSSLIEDIKQINDELENNKKNQNNNDERNNQINSPHNLHFQKHFGIENKCPICIDLSKKCKNETRKKGLFDRIDFKIYKSISRDRFNQYCEKFSPKNIFQKGKNEFEYFSDDENKMKNFLFNDAKKEKSSNFSGKKWKNLKITRNKSVINCLGGNNNINKNYNYIILHNDKNNLFNNIREGVFNYNVGNEKCELKDEYPALFGYFNSNNEKKNKTNDYFLMNSADHIF